ncbi:DNA translocase FtsK [Marinobacterium arenosum]|uniref:DNA translocase FtsK n=1 Tax=Marinobacterium arenosum TaxID=2862496 RepID=UPI001C963F16|nr:DNA translocase FtsK [Marinobacterium arenosum]MBY4677856.1 DNA translocase FtsK 4TM domain-containing protein [Marinobacterium arenosum]
MLLARTCKESGLIVVLGALLFLILALVGYDPRDPGWSHTGYQPQAQNFTGAAGAWLADLMISVFGVGAYLVPLLVLVPTVRFLSRRSVTLMESVPYFILRASGALLLLAPFCALVATHIANRTLAYPFSAGGLLGEALSDWSVSWFSVAGGSVMLFVTMLVGFTLYIELGWQLGLELLGDRIMRGLRRLLPQRDYDDQYDDEVYDPEDYRSESDIDVQPEEVAAEPSRQVAKVEKGGKPAESVSERREPAMDLDLLAEPQPAAVDADYDEPPFVPDPPRQQAAVAQPADTAKQQGEEARKNLKIVPLAEAHKPMQATELGLEAQQGAAKPKLNKRTLPSLDQLDPPALNQTAGYSDEQLEQMSRLLESKLKDFNVIAEVVEVNPGPVITRFEIQPAPGVKASKITNLAKDLARSMAVSSVRVVEVIPGKSVMGVEIPNEHRQTVSLSEVLNSKPYKEASSKLTLGLGNDIAGNPVVANLAKMPHLLVAGTTGSGKSVGVNAMLLSLLFKATPDEVRLIMVDPKMLELSIYEGIPHLLTPVITDMKDAAGALRWCVGEMERRYRLMAKMGVRNIAGFNDKLQAARASGQPIKDPLWNPEEQGLPADHPAPDLESLPYIVVVIDEFADMMMIVGKKVEELIARIAQKARAAGIHLILATQRPSVDVITGLIKANVPTRIAFQVSSKIDSRTILDQAGAEHLLGWGDMLYLPAGTSLPNRVHGAFVSDDEVHRVVDAWKKLGTPEYIDEILSADDGEGAASGGSAGLFDDEQDSLYDEAVAFVTETRKASISSVQRKLKIGYNRAARMIETMEAAGVVSPAGSNGQRDVLAPPPPRD